MTKDKVKLLEMKIGEVEWEGTTGIKRVFGGWIYMFYDNANDTITSSVFVPESLNCTVKN